MPPDDRTPHGDEILHPPPDRALIPLPEPGEIDELAADEESATLVDASARPALPDHPEMMAADIEDEDADPVIDTGPGIDDGIKGLKKQRG